MIIGIVVLFFIAAVVPKLFWWSFSIFCLLFFIMLRIGSKEEAEEKRKEQLKIEEQQKEKAEAQAKRNQIYAFKKGWPSQVLEASWIKNQCAIEATYQKGCSLYQSRFVHRIYYDNNKFFGRVTSSSAKKSYICEAEFDDNGQLLLQHCSCEAFKKYDGACKHLVAFYKGINDERLLCNLNDQKSEYYQPIKITEAIDNYFLNKTKISGNISVTGIIGNTYDDYFTLIQVNNRTIHSNLVKCYWATKEDGEYIKTHKGQPVELWAKVCYMHTQQIVILEIDIIKIIA